MLSNSEIFSRLLQVKPRLVRVGIENVGVFGSQIRGESGPESDLDILLNFQPGFETYRSFLDACEILESSFPEKKLDVVTVNGLSPFIGPYILKEVVYA